MHPSGAARSDREFSSPTLQRGPTMNKLQPIAALGVAPIVEATYPEPFKSRMGRFQCRLLGDEFGLTQLGANLEILSPGAQSALRHWHSLSDEFVFVLEGELVLRTDDGEVPVSAGMCVGFKAGTPNGASLRQSVGGRGVFWLSERASPAMLRPIPSTISCGAVTLAARMWRTRTALPIATGQC